MLTKKKGIILAKECQEIVEDRAREYELLAQAQERKKKFLRAKTNWTNLTQKLLVKERLNSKYSSKKGLKHCTSQNESVDIDLTENSLIESTNGKVDYPSKRPKISRACKHQFLEESFDGKLSTMICEYCGTKREEERL